MKIFTTTMLLLGCIIGAGFATGAEIVTFFNALPLPVWLTAALVGLAMGGVITLTIYLQRHPVATPRWLDYVRIGLYFILFTTMTAGVTQIAGWPVGWCALIFAALMVTFGFQHLTRINALIVISIVIVLGGVCLPHVCGPLKVSIDYAALPRGVWWAILYAGLNGLMLPELIAATARTCSAKTLYGAGVLTAGIIALFVGLILTAVKFTGTQNAAMPLLAASQHPATFIVILLAILTSQYAALFAMLQKLHVLWPQTKKTPSLWVGCFCVCGFIGSLFGFSRILNFGYPLIGLFTCFSLLFSWGSWVFLRPRPVPPER